MDLVNLLTNKALEWVPFISTLAGGIIVFLLLRFLLSGRFSSKLSEYQIINHLIFLSIFGFLIVVLILSLPVNEILSKLGKILVEYLNLDFYIQKFKQKNEL